MSGPAEAFRWGASTDALGVQGAAPASDWARWETLGRAPASRDGNGFATRYAEDTRLYAELGLTELRLGVDWARVEPAEGRVDGAALESYRRMLVAARDAGLSPWLCLWHTTLPGWFTEAGGVRDDKARGRYWPRHVDRVAEALGDLIHGWVPVHQPATWAWGAWLGGGLPPGRRDRLEWHKALRGAWLAHRDAFRLLRGAGQPVAVSMQATPVFRADDSPEARDAARLTDHALWHTPVRALRDGVLDLPGGAEEVVTDLAGSAGVVVFEATWAMAVGPAGRVQPWPLGAGPGPGGHHPWPRALALAARRLRDELPGMPLVAEVGVATTDDTERCRVLEDLVGEARDAAEDGAALRGVWFRPVIDAYAGRLGFTTPSGLVSRDREPRPSAALVASWARG